MLTVSPKDVTGSASKQVAEPSIEATGKQTATVEGLAASQQEEKPADLPKEDPQLTKRLAAIAREQKAVREARRRLDAERQQQATLVKELDELKSWKARLGQDPLNALNDVGISYEQLTNSVLNSPDPTIQKLLNEVENLKKSKEEDSKRMVAAEEARMAQAITQLKNDAKRLITNNPTYELIQLHGDQALETIAEIIKHDFEQTNDIKSIEEVANEVEEMLAEEALKVARTKKIQGLLTPKQEAALVEAQQKQSEKRETKTEKPQLSTLSNRITMTTKPLTDSERKRRAMAAFMGQKLD
jgi:hypothetical protein